MGDTAARLVGRDAELRQLRDCVQRAGSGVCTVITLNGEPGIGKSRLLAAAVELAREAGFSVHHGAGDSLGRTRPFAAVFAALGITASSPDPQRASIAVTVRAATLASAGELGGAAHLVADDVVDLVEQAATDHPVLLAIDDVQWADEGTILALRAMIRGLTGLPVLIVMCLRPGTLPASLALVLDDAAERVDIVLRGLDTAAVRALAEGVRGGPVPPEVAARIVVAHGNPFLIEIVAALDPEQLRDRALPSAVRDEIRRRALALGEDLVDCLRHAALLGGRFSVTLLADVTGRPVQEVAQLTQRALEQDLLVVDGADLAFRHDLVRETLADDVPLPVRVAMHSAIAHSLASAGRFSEVALHAAEGSRPGDREAVQWLRRGAVEVRRVAPALTVELLERAELLAAGDAAVHHEITLELLWALAAIGRTDSCITRAEALLATAPPASVAASAHACLGIVRQRLAQLPAARGHFDTAAALVQDDDPLRAAYLADAATTRALLGDSDGARASAATALAVVEGPPGARCEALCALAFAAHSDGDLEEALRHADAAVALEDGSDASLDGGNPMPRLYRGLALIDGGALADARSTLQQGRSRAERAGSTAQLPWYHLALAILNYISGDWSDASIDASAGLGLAAGVGTLIVSGPLQVVAARLAAHFGRPVEAAEPIWISPHRRAIMWAIEGPDAVRAARRDGTAAAVAADVAASLTGHGQAGGLVTAWCKGLAAGDGPTVLGAAEGLAESGRLGLAGRAFEDAGELGCGEGAYRRALELYERARADADVARVVPRLGGRSPRGAPGRATSGWASLTPSELAVVDLVAQGLGNRDVAQRLFISRHTVESHLKHVFTKLGIRSRLELAVEAVARSS